MAQSPQLNDSQLNLLAKIAANTGETQPKHGDGQHNLLFKIAQNTYASSGLAGSALQSSGDGYVICQQGEDFAAKYAEAKAKSPSATNRVTLFVVPGTYSLSSELAIDAEYVDIVGLGAQFQSPAVIVTNNTLNVTANDVRVSGVSVGTQEFKIASNKPLQVFENCKGGNNSFAGNGGTASGEFVGCVGGDDSFGGYDIEQSSTASFVNCIAGDDGFGGNSGEYPSGKYISCKITSGSFPTIYIPGRARFCLDDDYNIVNADGGYDSDAESYFTAAGVTDATAKNQLNLFVIGVKRLGLWSSIVCWPLRSTQNAGTGSTAYSLGGLGTYNGTLVNGPTWGTDGIDTSPSNAYIEIPQNFLNGANSIVGQTGSMLAVFANFATNFGVISNRGASGNFWTFGTRNSTTQIYIASNVTGATNQVVTKSGLNTNNLQFASWRINGSINRYTIRWNGTDSQSNIVSGGTASSRTNFQIGRENLSQFALKCAFCMTVEGLAISNEQHDALEILYKSTLGQGLGLP